MKKYILLFAFVQLLLCGYSQNNYKWPIVGDSVGQNIIYKPQSYIGNELVFDDLIITADYGTPVVAPTSGVIMFYNYSYHDGLQRQTTFQLKVNDWYSDSLEFVRLNEQNVKYINVLLALKSTDGKIIWIAGLRPFTNIKTGEKVNRGDTIGFVGYFYKKIDHPCVCVKISENKKSIDPMAPFGLQTTFKESKFTRPRLLKGEQAQNDFSILVESIKEGFPGLYDYITEHELEEFVKKQTPKFSQDISLEDFEKIIIETICKIKDCHTMLLNLTDDNPAMPTIALSVIDSNIIVSRTTPNNSKYYKKAVKLVDGIECDSLIKMVNQYLYSYDGNNLSCVENQLATVLDLKYCRFCQNTKNSDITIVFEDNEEKTFKIEPINQGKCVSLKPYWRDWFLINRRDLIMNMITDSTAYLGIPTFDLNELQVENICNYIKQISRDSVANLIIDLRNNSGGSKDVLNKVFSLIAQTDFRQTMYNMVNKKGNYDFFVYSTNHTIGDTLFPDFVFDENTHSFIDDCRDKWIHPDSISNYSGRVYVIINEWSLSAASVFAGLVKKHCRGVLVGRETGSAYHFIKAEKFENLMLPNSYCMVSFPLVKIVFDTVYNELFQYGRGVIPDYPMGISLDELESNNGDKLLNYTLNLIADGKYLTRASSEIMLLQKDSMPSGNKTKQNMIETTHNYSNKWFWMLIIAVVLSVVVITLKTNKHANNKES